MTDPSPLVRASAAEALGQRLDPPNTAALCQAAGDDYRLVRVRAATALAAVPGRNPARGPAFPGAQRASPN